MKLTSSILVLSALVPAGLFLAGCETTVRPVDPRANQVINASQISPQEWAQAADKLINNLLSSNVLDRAPEKPAILGISRIVNNTQQQVDTDELTKKIRVALNNTGKVLTTTTVGLGGKVEDPLAQQAEQYNQFMAGQKQVTRMPDYTLSGKLLEDRISQGNNTQITYTFQLSLTDVRTGLAVWESEQQISKVAHRDTLGW
ncbi:hypothetical protein GALL_103830 [mine drainage metagenome]|uniref:Penicillin-binding protein activator LpoB n=1 Tax=mine drainage metagenome TaxID=410659 RepID=A0A1J5STS1_9ZZZZ